MRTTAVFFPFALFGSAGTSLGAELLADAFEEMLADNRREQTPTRARAYMGHVRVRQLPLETLAEYQDWRARARRNVQQVFRNGDFLLWITAGHPYYLKLLCSDLFEKAQEQRERITRDVAASSINKSSSSFSVHLPPSFFLLSLFISLSPGLPVCVVFSSPLPPPLLNSSASKLFNF